MLMFIVRNTKLMIELYKNRNEFAVILDCSQNAALVNPHYPPREYKFGL